MKKRGKKTLGLLTTLFMLPVLLIQLTGCGEDAKTSQEVSVPEQEESKYEYTAKFQKLEVEDYIVGSVIFGKEGILYFSANKEGNSGLFSLKIGDDSPERLSAEFEADQYISSLGVDAEGNPVVGLIKYKYTNQDVEEKDGQAETDEEEKEGQIEHIEVRKLSADGGMLQSVDVTNIFINKKDFFMQSILADEKGNYYICSNQQVYVLNASGEVLYEDSADEYISNLFRIDDGRVIVSYYGKDGWRLKEVNLERKTLTEVESKIPFEYGIYRNGFDTDLIYTQGSNLYTYNLKDEQPNQILDWINNDVDSSKLNDFMILEDGRIAALSRDWSADDYSPELVILTRKSGDSDSTAGTEEKIILTYGTLYLSYYTNDDIVAFNKQSDKYRIEVKQYGDDTMDHDTKRSLMAADITGGRGPDMLDLDFGFSLEEYLNMGLLEDLTPYLENDGTLNRDDYLENIMEAYEKEGKLYAIMPSFGLNTIIGKVSDVGSGSSWTIEDMITLVESKPSDIEILPYSTKNSILKRMCRIGLDEFVNEETGECSFTSDEFKKLLEFANYFPKEESQDSNQLSDIEKVRTEKLLLINTAITSVELYQMYEYMFGEEVNFIGYPTTRENGSIITSYGTTVGMNVNSENKEGIWEFIRFNLSKERQSGSNRNGFPIMKKALEVQFAKDMATGTYVDINGEEKEKQNMTWGDGTFSVDVKAATEEQVERIKEMIEKAGKPSGSKENEILQIIEEESQAYFEGIKSVDDTSALIQNRVQLYINEKG